MTKQNASILNIIFICGCISLLGALIDEWGTAPELKQGIRVAIVVIFLCMSFFIYRKYYLRQVNPNMANKAFWRLFNKYPFLISVVAISAGVAVDILLRHVL